MRKRFIALLSALCLFACSFPVPAEETTEKTGAESVTDNPRSSLDYAPNIGARFIAWGGMYGLDSLKDDMAYSELDNGNKIMYIDDLAIVFDPATLETESITLFYDKDGDDKSHQISKFLSFVSAVEFEAPETWSETELGNAMEYSSGLFADMCRVYDKEFDRIAGGHIMAFRDTRCGTYCISYNADIGFLVSVR